LSMNPKATTLSISVSLSSHPLTLPQPLIAVAPLLHRRRRAPLLHRRRPARHLHR
ncbi:hypothetical protein S245_029664, partial [Arachis hypogaea]